MSTKTVRKLVFCICAAIVVALFAVPSIAQTTKTLKGTVVAVEGNNLVVKMSNGETQVFTPPPDRRFIIDGTPLTLAELQPGTSLTATVTETQTESILKTVETLEGKVLFASGPTVVLRLASGEVKKYVVTKDHPAEFSDQNGKPITVFDLKKGMLIKAKKVTEAPVAVFAQNTEVTGSAPKVAQAPAPAPAAEPQVAEPTTSTPAEAETPKMPKTGSSLPLIGQLGLLLSGIGFAIRRYFL